MGDERVQRPGTIIGAVLIGVVLAAFQVIGTVQLVTLLGELGNRPPTRIYVGFIVTAILIVLLIWGAVLAWRGKSTGLLTAGAAVVFVLSIVDFFSARFSTFVPLIFAVVAYLVIWLLRREQSQHFIAYSES